MKEIKEEIKREIKEEVKEEVQAKPGPAIPTQKAAATSNEPLLNRDNSVVRSAVLNNMITLPGNSRGFHRRHHHLLTYLADVYRLLPVTEV